MELEEAVRKVQNYSQLIRFLGLGRGSIKRLEKEISELSLDISHFSGYAWNKGLKTGSLLASYGSSNGRFKSGRYSRNRPCVRCGKFFNVEHNFVRKYCSVDCRYPQRSGIKQYRKRCGFRFSVRQFSNYFDLSILDKYGWYSPVSNPSGVSRDHLLSVSEGFKLGISSVLMRHPANCSLVLHSDNLRKSKNSVIDIDKLKKRIEEWKLAAP